MLSATFRAGPKRVPPAVSDAERKGGLQASAIGGGAHVLFRVAAEEDQRGLVGRARRIDHLARLVARPLPPIAVAHAGRLIEQDRDFREPPVAAIEPRSFVRIAPFSTSVVRVVLVQLCADLSARPLVRVQVSSWPCRCCTSSFVCARRRSVKWRMYPDDVLPAWVAEMDFPLAPAVKRGAAPAPSSATTAATRIPGRSARRSPPSRPTASAGGRPGAACSSSPT